MSYDSASPFRPEGVFSGGYVDNTPEHSLADKYSPYLRNARLDGMAIINRPGYSLLSTLTSGTYPRGIGSYLRTDPANDRLIVRHNTDGTHKLYTIDTDGNTTSIVTGANITSDNRMSFENIGDIIYCMNGVDDFGKLNGTTYTTPATGLSNFTPAFSTVFNGSLFASGWSAGDSKRVYKSVGNDYEDFSSAGSDTFDFQETITGLATHSQALYYFTQNTITITGDSDISDSGTTISYNTRALTVKEGSVNHAGIVTTGKRLFCITPSNKIVEVIRGASIEGFEVNELSERKYKGISKLMSTLDSDQSDCFGYFLPKDNLIAWHFKSKGSSFHDITIVYDTIKDAFLPDSNKFFYGGIHFKGLNYTISSIEPKVYIDEFGQDDEGSPIGFIYETRYFDGKLPTRKKELWESRVYVAINNLAELKQEIIIDGNTVDTKVVDKDNVPISTGGIGTAPVGTTPVGTGGGFIGEDILTNVSIIRTKGTLQKKGYKMKWRYSNNTLAGRVRLENLEGKIELLPQEADNLTI